jgi:hypothetical protein
MHTFVQHNQRKMAYTLSFESNDLNELLDFYRAKRDAIYQTLDPILDKIEDIEGLLKKQSNEPQRLANTTTLIPKPKYSGEFPEHETWLEKVLYLIAYNGGKATTKEMVITFEDKQPNSELDRAKLVNKLSAILSINSKEGGRIVKSKNSKGEFVYSENKEAASSEAA